MKLHFVNILHSAFSDCDRNWLDRVLALMYSEALGLCSCLSSHKMVSAVRDYHAVKMLNLSNENKVHNYVKTKCCILLGCIICIQERKWHEQMSVTFVCMASNTPPTPFHWYTRKYDSRCLYIWLWNIPSAQGDRWGTCIPSNYIKFP